MESGKLSESTFHKLVEKWVEGHKHHVFFADWKCKTVGGKYFLENVNVARYHQWKPENVKPSEIELLSGEFFPEDDQARLIEHSSNGGWLCLYTLHIVYSPVYTVPVLYFKAIHRDGSPCTLEEVERNLSGAATEMIQNHYNRANNTLISEEEHPLLGLPYFVVHPCQTGNRMAELMRTSVVEGFDYLIRWWSLVGGLLDLEMSPRLLSSLLTQIDS
mmetsp:Transcript_16594/g.20123  ORF Transcript_16594/g.20123 Transcript_16594/m.20123 type:complete len:217 (-) Transcript_16594:237-887(-)